MTDLCIECGVSVSGRKHAVTCDACERWQHRLCNTGISLADYRAATKGERELHFLCRACCISIPTPESEDGEEPMDKSMPSIVGDPVAESTLAYVEEQPSLQVSVLGDLWKRQGQLFSIHAFIEKDGQSQQFPLAFAIMSRKTIADYKEVFRVLMDKMGRVEVEGFVVDFEAAAWRALRESFPGKPIKGCVFHWNQAVWRHVQQFGLSATYQQREGVYDYIRQLMALPFLPARHIQQTFDHLKSKANTEPLQRLVNYIDRQWFHHPVFDMPSWCVFQQTVRTNNDVEGWHHRLNSKAGMCGLGFYRLAPLLRREATLMEMAIRAGDLQRNSRQTYRRMETKLQDFWTKYLDHEMSTTAFLRACGSLYGVRLTTPSTEAIESDD